MDTRTVLYIEDNFHNRRIARKILQSRGHVVLEAEDGMTGLEMVRNLKPAVVLLDIGLPGMDGLEVVARIKTDQTLRHIPVIALTASAMRGDRERFLAAGCDDYISKPLQAMELIAKVESHLATTGQTRTSSQEDVPQPKKNGSDGKKILLMEDDAYEARLLMRVLEREGYSIAHAPGGETGLRMAETEKPDLILLDLGLPDLDGQTVAALLKTMPGLAGVPLVAVTAWPPDTARQMAKAYGCAGYISKPISPREFPSQIAQYLAPAESGQHALTQ